MAGLHAPARPSWLCKLPDCGLPWPCPPKRAELLVEYEDPHNRAAIRMYLTLYLQDACADRPKERAGALWDRFFGWLPRPAPRVASSYMPDLDLVFDDDL
jgi:hypothetical protein